MGDNYSKADLRHIAEYLIEDLRECENGTVTTTRRLLDYAGYDVSEFEEWDLFDIHDSLFRAAKANHIKLDMSAHEGRLEGLPFNLDYVVHNSKAQIKCPRCGSKKTARIIYGYPLFSEKMQKMLNEGKWFRIVNTLYNNLYLHEWKKSYVDLDVLDGTQWELDIKLTDKRVRHYSGSNEYPPNWKELVKIFREYAKF